MIERRKNIERRKFLRYGTAALGSYALVTTMGSKINAAESTETTVASAGNKRYSNMSPDQAISELVQGNQRFVRQRARNPNQSRLRLLETSEGQSPFACILTCSDSRVPPEIIFDRGLGDLFVVRDAGNIATPEEIGSLEYATLLLGTKVLLVLGHERCGAIQATLATKPLPGQIGSIIEAIKPAVERAKNKPGDPVQNLVKENIFLQIERLHTSEVISQLVQQRKLKVVGAYYDLDTGKVHLI